MIHLSKIAHKKRGKNGFMLPGRIFTTSENEALEVLNKIEGMSRGINPVTRKVFVKPASVAPVVTRTKATNSRVFL